MPKTLSPLLAGAIAAALMGTTGYCVVSKGPGFPDASPPVLTKPLGLLPEAIIPYPLEDLPAPDADD